MGQLFFPSSCSLRRHTAGRDQGKRGKEGGNKNKKIKDSKEIEGNRNRKKEKKKTIYLDD